VREARLKSKWPRTTAHSIADSASHRERGEVTPNPFDVRGHTLFVPQYRSDTSTLSYIDLRIGLRFAGR